MAYKDGFPLKCRSREMVLVRGRVTFGASGVIDATKTLGTTYTWSRTSAGLYVITLDDTYPELDGATFTLIQAATTPGYNIQVAAEDVAVAKTVTILHTLNTGGTFAAADVVMGGKLGFLLWLRNLRAVVT